MGGCVETWRKDVDLIFVWRFIIKTSRMPLCLNDSFPSGGEGGKEEAEEERK